MPLPVMELTLDQPRTLRYTWGACIKLEHLAGKTIAQIINSLDFADMTAVRNLVWAGLLHEQPALTPDGTEPLLDAYMAAGGSLLDLYKAWNAAVVTSEMFGKPVPEKVGAEGNAVGGTSP